MGRLDLVKKRRERRSLSSGRWKNESKAYSKWLEVGVDAEMMGENLLLRFVIQMEEYTCQKPVSEKERLLSEWRPKGRHKSSFKGGTSHGSDVTCAFQWTGI